MGETATNYMWTGKVAELPVPMDERDKINELVKKMNSTIDTINQFAQVLQETSRVMDILKQSESLRALVNLEKPEPTNTNSHSMKLGTLYNRS